MVKMASFSPQDIASRLQARQEEFKRIAVAGLRVEAMKLVADGFNQSRDPWGNQWAPLKVRKGKPLIDTGRLRASFTAQTDTVLSKITVGTNVSYAIYHQYGATKKEGTVTVYRATQGKNKGKFAKKTSKTAIKQTYGFSMRQIPARPMLPIGRPSEIWNKAIKNIVEEAIRKAFK
jgi:phage gpG-like protein